MSRDSFPELPKMPDPIAEIPVKALASLIARTSFAISMEESRFTLSGALLILRPDSMTMVADPTAIAWPMFRPRAKTRV